MNTQHESKSKRKANRLDRAEPMIREGKEKKTRMTGVFTIHTLKLLVNLCTCVVNALKRHLAALPCQGRFKSPIKYGVDGSKNMIVVQHLCTTDRTPKQRKGFNLEERNLKSV
jgi:hypothetical protein